jgi:hypothetical protein
MTLRQRYVAVARRLRRAAERLHVVEWLDGRRRLHPRGTAAHLRSLLAIHDVDDMVALGVPWWTYSAIDAVDSYLQGLGGRARVFEFGSGASTIWLAERAAEVHVVEHDEDWAAKVRSLLDARPELSAKVTLHVVPALPSPRPATPSAGRGAANLDFTDYVATIERVGGEFDLVSVDGRAREACLDASLSHLAPHGVVLVDDSHRLRYRRALRDSGLRVQRHRGLVPSLPYPRETATLHA